MKNTSQHNQVRISAGNWRNRLLKFPATEALRPTPERVRQTVFNWLGQDLTNKHCLDLFAGSGVFGFESLSRHAQSATLIEFSTVAYQHLLRNKTLLNAQQANIIHTDALKFLNDNQQKFDIIFCDPPFNKTWLAKLLPILGMHLNVDGLVYIEAEYALISTTPWQVIKYNKAGNVFYHLLKFQPS